MKIGICVFCSQVEVVEDGGGNCWDCCKYVVLDKHLYDFEDSVTYGRLLGTEVSFVHQTLLQMKLSAAVVFMC